MTQYMDRTNTQTWSLHGNNYVPYWQITETQVFRGQSDSATISKYLTQESN